MNRMFEELYAKKVTTIKLIFINSATAAFDNQPKTEPKTTVTSVITEINERKNRRNNLIIHGTEECISENKQERIHHDQELVNDIAK